MSSGTSWTAAEEAILRWTWPEIQTANIAALIARSPASIKSRAKALRLRKLKGHKPWTAAEDQLLREQFPHRSNKEIAAQLGRGLYSINQHAHKVLGLRKTAEYMASPAACRLRRGDNVGAATRFKKGLIPANKGIKRPGWAPGRMKETQFKKGQRSVNTLPVGTIIPDSDGYLRRKIFEGSGGFGNEHVWERIHRRVWEDAHGPIPKGHALIFKDKNRAHCELDNLELLSRAELMLRNTVHNLPPALKQVIHLTGALKRKIRNREEKLYGKEHIAGSEGSPVRPTGSTERQGESAGS
jgi:HNH endonuclease